MTKAVPAPKTSKEFIAARKAAKRMEVPNHPSRPEIVSTVPVPTQTRGGCRKFDHYYPFEDMKPGDSFWVPSATQCTAGAISKFAKKSGWKFTARAQTREGRLNSEVGEQKRGTRVWRVS